MNNEDVGHMTLEELQDLLVSKPWRLQTGSLVICNVIHIQKGSSGNILIKVRPTSQEPVQQSEVGALI